jgi:hypothetical protein
MTSIFVFILSVFPFTRDIVVYVSSSIMVAEDTQLLVCHLCYLHILASKLCKPALFPARRHRSNVQASKYQRKMLGHAFFQSTGTPYPDLKTPLQSIDTLDLRSAIGI